VDATSSLKDNPKAQGAAEGHRAAPEAGGEAMVVDRYANAIVLAERESQIAAAGEPRVLRLRLIRDVSFKYPLIRVEDELREAPGGRVLVRQTAMVGDHVMVKMKDAKMDEAALLAQLKHLGATVRRKMPASGVWLVAFPKADLDTVPAGIEEMGKLAALVRYAEPDYIAHTMATPNDTSFANLWGMHNTGQSGGDGGRRHRCTGGLGYSHGQRDGEGGRDRHGHRPHPSGFSGQHVDESGRNRGQRDR